MTKQLYQYFFRGLITALPLGLTVYLLYIFLHWSETLAMRLLRPFIGDVYIQEWVCFWAYSAFSCWGFWFRIA